ncbi:hypothetical protein ACS72_05630 [Acinetobacter sp. VT 511]|nr:hypothetical protein ACS72_05630 [Acinetobacter sp. VT 511]
MIDYELLPKASFYYGKIFFHPVLLSLEHEPCEPLALWVVNDTRDVMKGQLRLNVYTLNGEKIYSSSHAVEVTSQSSRCIAELTEVEVLQGRRAEEVMVELVSEGFAAPRLTGSFVTPCETSHNPKEQALWFGLLRVRSPLLTESLLFSLPQGT